MIDAALMQLVQRLASVEQAFERIAGRELPTGTVRQRGATGNFSGTRTVASFADVDSTNGKVTLLTTGGDIVALFFGYCSNTNAPVVQQIAVRIDSAAEVGLVPVYSYNALATYPVPFFTGALFTGVSGTRSVPVSHTVYARHINNSAIGTMTTSGYLIVVEIGPP